jgi:integrase/recombinase XerD
LNTPFILIKNSEWMGCFLLSLDYFDMQEKVGKRKPHKRKDEKVVKKESVKVAFERFLELKVIQNLRPA